MKKVIAVSVSFLIFLNLLSVNINADTTQLLMYDTIGGYVDIDFGWSNSLGKNEHVRILCDSEVRDYYPQYSISCIGLDVYSFKNYKIVINKIISIKNYYKGFVYKVDSTITISTGKKNITFEIELI